MEGEKMVEVGRNDMFFSRDGGVIDFVSKDGEVLVSVGVPAGVQAARQYLDALPHGAHIEVVEGLAVIPKNGRAWFGSQRSPLSHESGANPDFVPTSASSINLQMQQLMRQMQAKDKRISARLRALEGIERIPVAVGPQQVDAQPVVEPVQVTPQA
jgi:hypothetical protein